MSVLITGASGFLGKTIVKALGQENIQAIGRAAASTYPCDLSSAIPEIKTRSEMIVHAAGKAHSVPRTEEEKQEFFEVNVTGTQNLLTGLERSGLPESFIFISTVAVYGKSSGTLIPETASLNASDAYGKSKIEAEGIIRNWCSKNNVKCAILRLPLIAGPNPPGNLAAMIRGIQKGYYLNIAGGIARKSIVLAEDVARILPKAASAGGVFNLTDGYHPSFFELSELISRQLGKSTPGSVPGWLASLMAKAGDLIGDKAPINSEKLLKITSDLTFDDSAAQRELGWSPKPVLEGFTIR